MANAGQAAPCRSRAATPSQSDGKDLGRDDGRDYGRVLANSLPEGHGPPGQGQSHGIKVTARLGERRLAA
jgi:hypothetical protein